MLMMMISLTITIIEFAQHAENHVYVAYAAKEYTRKKN